MINLLPVEIKHRHRLRSINYTIIAIYIGIATVVGLSLVAAETATYFRNIQNNAKAVDLDLLLKRKSSGEEVISKAAFIQDRLNKRAQLSGQSDLTSLVDEIASKTPTDIQLTFIRYSDTDKTIELTGMSPERRTAILFKDSLATSKIITEVSLVNLADSPATPLPITFSFTGKVSLPGVEKK